MTSAQTGEHLTQLDPAVILADANVRFGLKPMQVEKLAEDILAYGGVHTPAEVEKLPTPIDGKSYRLTVGHYRLAAVDHLNRTQNAGLTLPVLVRPQADETQRLKRQLSENVERESLSPMDMAVSIKKLLAAGVPRLEVRKIFARPVGKKNIAYQPASNAWINIVQSFLDLPKAMQEKIHDGRIGIGAAYELTRVSPEKRAAVLERAETERLRAIEQEEKDEEKYLASQRKVEEIKATVDEVVSELEAAKAAAATASKIAKEKAAEVKTRIAEGSKGFLALPAEEQKTVTASLVQVKAELKLAEVAEKKALAAVEKLQGKEKKVSERAAEAAERLTAARKAHAKAAQSKGGKPGAKPVGAKDVQKAAAQEGATPAGAKLKPLTATEMRAALVEIGIPTYPTVMAVCTILSHCFNSELTPLQAMRELAILLKEPNVPKSKKAPEKAQ